MKNLALILCLIFSCYLHGQRNDFNRLLHLFQESKKVIPQELAFTYFNFTPSKDHSDLLTEKVLIKTDQFIALVTYINCFAGGQCETSTVTTFDLKGNRIDQIEFESDHADCSFQSSREAVYTSEELIIIKNTEIIEDCGGETDDRKEEMNLESIEITITGKFSKPQYQYIDLRREHPYFSFKIFNKEDIILISKKKELAVIRNEIFAAHGYKFKTKKWQDYFATKKWYSPLLDNVNDKLSIIEKKNIQSLKEIEDK